MSLCSCALLLTLYSKLCAVWFTHKSSFKDNQQRCVGTGWALTNVGLFGQPIDLILVFICQAKGSVLVFTLGEPIGLHHGRKDRETIPGIQGGIIAVCVNACMGMKSEQAEVGQGIEFIPYSPYSIDVLLLLRDADQLFLQTGAKQIDMLHTAT